ncbi:hypothetical protein HKX48_000316 [Thoreauomyces humboldtii]|nr:hypothetical protein HKX48_000316 [Thoreauomyces humboldtii]
MSSSHRSTAGSTSTTTRPPPQPQPDSETTTAQVKRYESFVNDRLRVDLQSTLDTRDKVYEDISEYLKLRNQLQLLREQKLTELKTLMDVGCEFFMQANIPSLDHVFVKVGLDTHVQLTFEEALAFIDKKEKVLLSSAETHTEKASKIKAQIKMVLSTIETILQLERSDTPAHREP